MDIVIGKIKIILRNNFSGICCAISTHITYFSIVRVWIIKENLVTVLYKTIIKKIIKKCYFHFSDEDYG